MYFIGVWCPARLLAVSMAPEAWVDLAILDVLGKVSLPPCLQHPRPMRLRLLVQSFACLPPA